MAGATAASQPFQLLCEASGVYAAALAGPGINSIVTLNTYGSLGNNPPAWVIGSDNRIYYGSTPGDYCLDAFFPGTGGNGGNGSQAGSFVFLNAVINAPDNTPSLSQLWNWGKNSSGTLWYISNIGLNKAYPGLGWLWLNNDNGGSGPNQHLQLFSYGEGNNPGSDPNSCWTQANPGA